MSYTDNRTILQKADLALADLTAGGGILKPAQAQKFMRLLIKDSPLMRLATVVPMQSPKQQLSKIKFGSRVLRPGAEATALPLADRARPDLSQVELDAKLFKAEVRLSDEVLEDSIERGELRQTIMEMMAEAISRDMEEVLINGDTLSADPFLAVMDGALKQATSNVVDAGGAAISKNLLRDMLKTIPSEHLRDKKAMRFMTSVDADLDYRNTLAERATAVGDRLLEAAWREALWLVKDDIVTVEELDDIMRYSFGIRWAQMGMFQVYRVAGGEAGMRHFMAQFGPCLKWPWTKLMDVPELTDELVDKIAEQSDAQAHGLSIRQLERIRDDNLVAIMEALSKQNKGKGWGAGALHNDYTKRLAKLASNKPKTSKAAAKAKAEKPVKKAKAAKKKKG